MDQRAVLAAFGEQVRRHPQADHPDDQIEYDERVIRYVSSSWLGVTWSDLDEDTADGVIAAQIDRFAELSRDWEWKYYSYDDPKDLPDRLLAAGFKPEEAEAFLVAEIADLTLDATPPPGVVVRPVADERDLEALVSVHDEVFGEDHSGLGKVLLAGLDQDPPTVVPVVAWAGETPICAGRVEFHAGTDFASLWGGGTLKEWRGRGVFRSLVAYRASLAASRGFRYLSVDASPDSRPILERLGFVELATTIPFVHPPGG
jgi:GNAT superfamily N-acetyltransferase